MKASELRMENWVYIPQYKENKQIGVVYENGSFVTKNNEHSFSSIECATPIRLTEEWFDKIEKTDWEFVGFGTRTIYQHKKFKSIKIELSGYNHVAFYFNDELINLKEYVHQLQNLFFALTGEELTFKEF